MTCRELVDLLNRMSELDPQATRDLFDHRVAVNAALADSDLPMVVGEHPDGTLTMGPCGLLNGIVGTADERVCAVYDGETLQRFEVLHLRDEATAHREDACDT